MTSMLLSTLALSLGIQAVFFAVAAWFRTDKVTDLSYGLTFIAIALYLVAGVDAPRAPEIVLTAMVVVWGARLAGYLFYRILHMGSDARFDGIRERFWSFLRFWLFQGIAVWIVMIPASLWFARPAPDRAWAWPMAIGASVWLIGLVIESVADAQKFRFKRQASTRARWVDTGLWRYSRHPNYFGELLCWWGLFLFTVPGLGWWAAAGLAGPVAITVILLFATGIPTLEASAERKWGRDPEYLAYRRRTNRLAPWPPVLPVVSTPDHGVDRNQTDGP